MKICFLSEFMGTIPGGTEAVVYHFAKELSYKHRVTVITGNVMGKFRRDILNNKFSVYTVPIIPGSLLVSRVIAKFVQIFYHSFYAHCLTSLTFYLNVILSAQIKRILREQDIVSVHDWISSILFSRYLLKKHIPVVFYMPGVEGRHFFKQDRASLYIANSQTTKNKIEQEFKIKLDGLVTPGIENRISQDLPPFEKRRDLLFVGRLEEGKGLWELIEIFAKLKMVYHNLKLKIVGDGTLQGALKREIIKRNLKENVEFIGWVSPQELHTYYSSSLVFVFPSTFESFGIAVQEAMAYGLVVVATDLPAIREASNNKAILLERNNLDLWVNEISGLLKDKQRWERLSRESKEVVSGRTWEKKSQEFERFLLKTTSDFKVSVIVPTYKRPASLKNCLVSLIKQIHKLDQIIVVIRETDTASQEMIKELQTQTGFTQVYVNRPGQNFSKNAGLEKTTGDIICFIDDDAQAKEDWIRNIIRHYKNPRVGAVGGPAILMVNGKPKDKSFACRTLWFGANVRKRIVSSQKTIYTNVLQGCNMSFRRRVIVEFDKNLKGYVEREDDDQVLNVVQKGFLAIFDPEVIVYHHQAPLQVNYSRNRFDRFTAKCSQHNNVYVYLKHHNLIFKIIFIFFTFLIGDLPYPGLLVYIAWFLYKRNLVILKVIPSAFLGKLQGIMTYLEYRKDANKFSR